MKKDAKFLIALVVLGEWVGGAMAMNITIPDNANPSLGSQGVGQAREDEEWEVSTRLQAYDMEAFLLEGNILSMVGGYNMHNTAWPAGDIFIDVNGGAQYGVSIPQDSPFNDPDVNVIENNRMGYEYVIKMGLAHEVGAGQYQYKVYQLTDDSDLLTVAPVQNYWSSPWRLDERSAIELTNAGGIFSILGGLSDLDVGFLGDDGGAPSHYITTGFDLSFLEQQDQSLNLVHFTMKCGNDSLIGKVPDGGMTLALLGFALAGLSLGAKRW